MRKISMVIFVCLITLSIPVVVYAWLQSIAGDLGNINVMENYVPWIFHLMLWQFAFMVGLVLMLLVLGSGSPEPDELSSEERERIKFFKRHMQDPIKAQRKTKTIKKTKKQARKTHAHTKKEKPPAAQPDEEPEKEEPEAPDAWQTEEFE